MKRYIAFHGNSNSAIVTYDKALEWAKDLLGKTNSSKVHIAEVTEVVERSHPPIEVKPFKLPEAIAEAA